MEPLEPPLNPPLQWKCPSAETLIATDWLTAKGAYIAM